VNRFSTSMVTEYVDKCITLDGPIVLSCHVNVVSLSFSDHVIPVVCMIVKLYRMPQIFTLRIDNEITHAETYG